MDEEISRERISFAKPLSKPVEDDTKLPVAVKNAIAAMEKGDKVGGASGLSPEEVLRRRTGASTTKHISPIESTPKSEETDANLREIFLPSQFEPYSFKRLFAKPMRGAHIARFNTAHRTGSFRLMVDTVSSLMVGASARDLTMPDFDALLYDLRINSFTRRPLQHVAICYNEKHIEDVIKEELPESSLETVAIVDKTILHEKTLDSSDIEKQIQALRDVGIEYEFQYPIVGDTVEVEELIDRLEIAKSRKGADVVAIKGDIEDINFLSLRATVLSRATYGSLENRIAMMRDAEPDVLEELNKLSELFNSYGISETIEVTCKECGAKIETKVSINALSFL